MAAALGLSPSIGAPALSEARPLEQLFGFLERAWPFVLVIAGWIGAVMNAERIRRRDATQEKADLVRIAQDAAGTMIAALQKEVDRGREAYDRLMERVDELESEMSQLRKEHAAVLANKDAEITLLRGENRMLQAQVHGLEELLVRHGIPIPRSAQPFWEVSDGELKPIQPEVKP